MRHLYLIRRSMDRVFDLFYWPVIDLLLWGLTSFFIKEFAPNASLVVLIIVSGVVFWLIVWRGQNDIGVSLLEDLWNKNMINLFVSPLRFSEWLIALMTLGTMKVLVSFPFAILASFLLFKVKIFSFGVSVLPFAFSLLLTGWWVGCIVNGLILRFGTRIQIIAWSLVMLIAPFSAIYYPLSVLPVWAQNIALAVPTSYVFEGIREVINTGHADIFKIIMSFSLNIVYLILAMIFMKRGFKKVLNRGLVKLY